MNRQQRRHAERQTAKGKVPNEQGMVLNIIQVPRTKKFRIQQRGTMNIMRGPNGEIIEFPTAESAHAALVRLKALTVSNVKKSQKDVEVFRQAVAQQVTTAKAAGVATGLEGTYFDQGTDVSNAEAPPIAAP